MTSFNRPSIPVLGQQPAQQDPAEGLPPLPDLSPYVVPTEPPQPTDRELMVLGEKNQSGMADFGSELGRTFTNVVPGSLLHTGAEAVGSLLGWSSDQFLKWQTGKTPEEMAVDLESRASKQSNPALAFDLRKKASEIRQARRAIGLTDFRQSTLELSSGSGSAITGQAGSAFGQQDPLSREEYGQTLYDPEGWGAFTGALSGSVIMSGLSVVQPSLAPAVLASFGAMGFVGGKQAYIDTMTELGVEVDPVVADMVGLASGLIELGSEYIGLDVIPEAIRGRVISEMAQAALAGETRAAAKTLVRAIKLAAPAAAVEGLEEVVSQIGQNAANLVGEMVSTGNVPTVDQARKRILEGTGSSFLGGAIAGGALSGPVALYGTAKTEKAMYRASAKQKLERSNLGEFESIGAVDDKAVADAALGSNLYQLTVAGKELGRKEAAAEAKRRGLTLTAQELSDPAGIEVAADDEKKNAMVQAVRARLIALSNLGVEDPSLSRGDIRSITGEANIGELNSKAARSKAVSSMMQVEIKEQAARMAPQAEQASERSPQEQTEQEMLDKVVPGSKVSSVSRDKIGDRERSVEAMARKLGVRVVWFSGRVAQNGKEIATGGFQDPGQPGTVFLRHSGGTKFDEASMRDAYLGLVAHEASHDRELSTEGKSAVRNLLNAAFVRTPGLIGRMFGMKAKSIFGEMTKENKIAWLESRGYSPDVIAQGANESEEAHAKRVDSEVASVLQEDPNLLEEIGAYSLIQDDVGMVRKGLDYVRRTITKMGLRGADAQAVLKYLRDSIDVATRNKSQASPSAEQTAQQAKESAKAESAIEARFSASNRQLGVFNSRLPQSLASMPQRKATPEQVIAHLKKSGVKDEEIKFSGLPEFLAGKKTVSIDDVMQAIQPVEVYESILSSRNDVIPKTMKMVKKKLNDSITVERVNPSEDGGKVRWKVSEQLSNGAPGQRTEMFDSRRQAMEHRKSRIDENMAWAAKMDRQDLFEEFDIDVAQYEDRGLQVEGPVREYFEVLLHWVPTGASFYNNHFRHPNIVVHSRVTIRDRHVEDENGNTRRSGQVMFVEEIQSDWHQQGRENGYIDEYARRAHRNSKPSDYEVSISESRIVPENGRISFEGEAWYGSGSGRSTSADGKKRSMSVDGKKLHGLYEEGHVRPGVPYALAERPSYQDLIGMNPSIVPADPMTWGYRSFLYPDEHDLANWEAAGIDRVIDAVRQLTVYTYTIKHKTNSDLEPVTVMSVGLSPASNDDLVEAELIGPQAQEDGVLSGKVSAAPFRSSSAWSAFMLKRLMAIAASKPKVRELVMIDGQTTAERYDELLVDNLELVRVERKLNSGGRAHYLIQGKRPETSPDEYEVEVRVDDLDNLEDYVGSSVAEKIRKSAWTDAGDGSGTSFVEVKVDETDTVGTTRASGYKKFYDEIVVKQMRNVAALSGASMSKYSFPDLPDISWKEFSSIVIDDKVRGNIASVGFPLFSSSDKLQLGTYHSQLFQSLAGSPQKKMTPQQIIAHLKKNGVKDEEIYWTGLSDFLNGKTDAIEVSHVLQSIKPVEIDDKLLSSPDLSLAYETAYNSIYDQYLVVGKGKNWRIKSDYVDVDEIEGRFPSEQLALSALEKIVADRVGKMSYREMLAAGDFYGVDDMPEYGIEAQGDAYLMSGPIEGYAEMLLTLDGVGSGATPGFDGGHFAEKNVLVHTRFTDRTGKSASGESFKTLFIEEIQSDWHQKGREHGYKESGDLSFDVVPVDANVDLFTSEWSNAKRSGLGRPDLKDGRPGTWKPDAKVSSNSILELQFKADKQFTFVWSVPSIQEPGKASDVKRLIQQHGETSTFAVRGDDLNAFPADALSFDYGEKVPVSEIWKKDSAWERKNRKRIAESVKPWVIQARWKSGTVAFTIAGITGDPNDVISQLSSPSNRSRIERYLSTRAQTEQTVEAAPFKSSTSWASLALKRMLSFASDAYMPYAAVSMITGAETADRYETMLVTNVSEINVEMQDPGDPMNGLKITAKRAGSDTDIVVGQYVSRELLRDYIGNEMAEQVASGLDRGETQWNFTGSDMTVGKSGYQKFYDEIVVKEMEKIAKRAGARIETLSIDKGDGKTLQAPSIILDEASMQRIRSSGFPMFSASGGTSKGRRDEYGTYSHLLKLIETSPQRKMTKQQLISYLKKNGIKDEEIYWTGLSNYLAGVESVILDHVQSAIHPIVVHQEVNPEATESESGEDEARGAAYDVMYNEYEIVAHLEYVDVETADGEIVQEEVEVADSYDVMIDGSVQNGDPIPSRREAERYITEDIYNRLNYMTRAELFEYAGYEEPEALGKYEEYVLSGEYENYQEILVTFDEATGVDGSPLPTIGSGRNRVYSSPHWDTHNVIVAPRTTDRREQGRPYDQSNVKFIEEVQSDWHQDASGYVTPQLSEEMNQVQFEYVDLDPVKADWSGVKVGILPADDGDVLRGRGDKLVAAILIQNETNDASESLIIEGTSNPSPDSRSRAQPFIQTQIARRYIEPGNRWRIEAAGGGLMFDFENDVRRGESSRWFIVDVFKLLLPWSEKSYDNWQKLSSLRDAIFEGTSYEAQAAAIELSKIVESIEYRGKFVRRIQNSGRADLNQVADEMVEGSRREFSAWAADGDVIGQIQTLDDAHARFRGIVTRSFAPDAPFKSTNSWASLGLKRVIAHAIENSPGVDTIALIDSVETAKRYGAALERAAQAVRIVRYSTTDLFELWIKRPGDPDVSWERVSVRTTTNLVKRSDLGRWIGGTAADNLLQQIDRGQPDAEISGTEMTVGVNKYKQFYDVLLPKELEKIAKKYNSSLSTVTIDRGSEVAPEIRFQTYPAMRITDEMRAAVGSVGFPLFSSSGRKFTRPQFNAVVVSRFSRDYRQTGRIDETTGFILDDGTPVSMGVDIRMEDHRAIVGTAKDLERMGVSSDAARQAETGSRTTAMREIMRIHSVLRVHVNRSDMSIEVSSGQSVTSRQRASIRDFLVENPKVSSVNIEIENSRGDFRQIELDDASPDEVVHYLSFSASSQERRLVKASSSSTMRGAPSSASKSILDSANRYIDKQISYLDLEADVLNAMVPFEAKRPGSTSNIIRSIMVPAGGIERERNGVKFSAGKKNLTGEFWVSRGSINDYMDASDMGGADHEMRSANMAYLHLVEIVRSKFQLPEFDGSDIHWIQLDADVYRGPIGAASDSIEDMRTAWKEVARVCAEDDVSAAMAMKVMGTEDNWSFSIRKPKIGNARQAIESLIEFAFMVGLDGKTVDSRAFAFAQGYMRIDGNNVEMTRIDSTSIKALVDAMYNLHGDFAEGQVLDIEVIGESRRMFNDVPISVLESESVAKLAPYRSARYSASRTPITITVVPNNRDEDYPVAKGLKAVIARISREMSQGKLDTYQGTRMISIVGLIGRAMMTNTGIRFRKLSRDSINGYFDFARDVVTISQKAIERGDAIETLVHEFWHSASRFLHPDMVERIKKDYERNLAIFIARHGFNPRWLTEDPHALGVALSSGLDWYYIYKHVNLDEWIAVTMTERTMLLLGRTHAPSIQPGNVRTTVVSEQSKSMLRFLSDMFYSSVSDAARFVLGVENGMYDSLAEDFLSGNMGLNGGTHYDDPIELSAYDMFQRSGNVIPFAIPESPRGSVPTDSHPVTGILRQMPVVRDVMAARFSAGSKLKPIPTSVDDVSRMSSMLDMARSRRFQNQYEFRLGMQEAVQKEAEAAGVDLSVDTPERRAYLARAIESEARLAIAQKTNGVGWYNLKVRVALAVSSLVHPEIQSDPTAQFMFKVCLAISSNGMKVEKNFIIADRMYESWKETGKLPVNMGQGTAADVMNASCEVVNGLAKKMGMPRLMELMTSKMPRKAAEAALGVKISGEGVETLVYGASFLGPKIGNGFFANLNGNYEQLTMDRWYIRGWGRLLGKHIIIDRAMIAEKRSELRSFLDLLSSPKYVLLKKEMESVFGFRLSKSRLDEVAKAINNKTGDKKIRERLMKIGVADQSILDDFVPIVGESDKRSPHVSVGNMTRKMGQRLVRWLDKRYEAPAGIGERNEMRDVMGTVLSRLQADFPVLEMADLQAILWYPEKQLYDVAKMNSEQSEADDAEYDESEAPDYANAAIELARTKGIAETRIQEAVKNVETAIASERAAGTGRGAGASGLSDEVQQSLPGDASLPGEPVNFSASVTGPTRMKSRGSGYVPNTAEIAEHWASFPGPESTYGEGELSEYLSKLKSDGWFSQWFEGSVAVHSESKLPAVCRMASWSGDFPVYLTSTGPGSDGVPMFLAIRNPLVLPYASDTDEGLSEPRYSTKDLEAAFGVSMKEPREPGQVIGGSSRHTLVEAWSAQTADVQAQIVTRLSRMGMDGISSAISGDHPSQTYIPFDATQVKVVESATWGARNTSVSFSASAPGRIELTQENKEFLRGTKVADKQGNPIPVWHGSWTYINRFMYDFLGGSRSWEIFGAGFNFTTYFEDARRYAIQRTGRQARGEMTYSRKTRVPGIGELRPTVTKAFLSIKNPIAVVADGTRVISTGRLNVDRSMLEKFLKFAPKSVREQYDGPSLNSMVEDLSGEHAVNKLREIKHAFFGNDVKRFLDAARAATGHDGIQVTMKEDNGVTSIPVTHWIAWSEAQIVNGGGKLVDDVPTGASFSAGAGKFDTTSWMRARAKGQDAYIQLEKAIGDIEKASGALPPTMNPLLAIRRMASAVADRQSNFRSKKVNPLLGRMKDARISMRDMGEFLFALHALERNQYIREINPGSEGVGSGMSDERAKRIIGNVDARPDAALWRSIASEWHGIARESLETQLASGLIRQSDFDNITSRYKSYVPMPDAPDGSGAPIEGEVKRFSLGRQQLRQTVGRGEDSIEDESFIAVIPHIVGQRESIMSRAFRNIVANRFLMLAIHHPAPEMWSIFRPGTVRRMNVRTGVVEEVEDQSWRDDPQIMQVLAVRQMRYTHTAIVDGRPVETEYEVQRGEMVLIRIGDRQLGEILTRGKMPPEHWAMSVVKMARLWSRWVRWTATSMFNPDFTFTNPVRDLQTALATIVTEEKSARKIALEMAKLYAPAFKAVMNSLRGRPVGDLENEWQDFNRLGGRQSLFVPQTFDERYEELQREIEDPTRWRTMSSAARRLLVDSWDNLNSSFDNAVRFAFYVAAVRNGVHPEVAVVKARNLTVDFSKRGSDTGVLWTMYAFGNAGLQGTAKTMRLLKTRRGRAIMGSLFAIGFIQALLTEALGSDDDDKNGIKDVDGVQEYIHTTNLVIPTGMGFALKIPVSYGLNVPLVMGRQTYRAMAGLTKPGSALGEIANTMLSTFNPIGGEGIADSGHGLLRAIAPDVLDLPVDMAFGKDWMGNPLYKVSAWERDPILSETGSAKVPEPVKAFCRMLNDASGGDYATKGYLDFPPDAVWYLLAQLAGGGGRAIERIGETIANTMQGEFEANVVPGLRRFVEQYPTPQQGASAYYAIREEVLGLDTRLGRYGTQQEKDQASKENLAASRSIQAFKDAESQIKSLRARVRELRAHGASTSAIEAQERLMVRARTEAVKAYMRAKSK